MAILRDVSLKIEAAEGGRLRFEGTARGDLFEKLSLEGSIDPTTGDTTLQGELAGLDPLGEPAPPPPRRSSARPSTPWR